MPALMAFRGWVLCLVALLLVQTPVLRAQAPHNVAERYLFQIANAERVSRGLEPLAWDETLYRAASRHAQEMARWQSISHRYSDEADLADRAGSAGVHFSTVAENVAEAPTAVQIHRGWMASEHHRENLLDARLDRVAISVWMRDGELYAVEDFDQAVPQLSFGEQERTVADLMETVAGLHVEVASDQARETCRMETGFAAGHRPWFVMRFSASSLTALPGELIAKLGTGRYREAEVGACPLRDAGSFSGYNIAVLLFP